MEPHIPAPAEPPTRAPLLHLRGHAPLKPSLKAGLPSRVIRDDPMHQTLHVRPLSVTLQRPVSPHFLEIGGDGKPGAGPAGKQQVFR